MAESWTVHTVVFDLDDTLYPERDYVFSGFSAVDDWLRVRSEVTGFAARARTFFESGIRGRIFDDVLKDLKADQSEELVRQLVKVYRQHWPKIVLPEESKTILAWCADRFNLGLITDGYRGVQETKIAALGLESRIPCRIVTDSLGREFWKPSPVPYRKVMETYGGDAKGFVYVADNPAKDFVGATLLGWRTIRIKRPCGEHSNATALPGCDAEVTFTSLEQLSERLTDA